jgi:hypothetical protein
MNAGIVPATVWSACDCIAPIAPSTWALNWVVEDQQARLKHLREFGIKEDRLAELVDWTSNKFGNGFGWPHFFTDIVTAREFLRTFVPADSDARLLALCLSTSDGLELLDECQNLNRHVGENAICGMLRSSVSPPAGGRECGSDILNTDIAGSFHSYLCNGLEVGIKANFGAIPNGIGIFDDHEVARAAAKWIEADGTAEPGPWNAFRVVEYDRD